MEIKLPDEIIYSTELPTSFTLYIPYLLPINPFEINELVSCIVLKLEYRLDPFVSSPRGEHAYRITERSMSEVRCFLDKKGAMYNGT